MLTGSSPKVAAGGGDAYDDGMSKYFAYHYYDANSAGRETLDIRQVTFSNGWPVMGVPLSQASAGGASQRKGGAPPHFVA